MSLENNKGTVEHTNDKSSNQSHQTNYDKNNIHNKSDKLQTDKDQKDCNNKNKY
ncbi:hypothetical protein [Rickettsia endosymbiont of Cantharis rufa]|uniref:hypothetical protein n=1 Tax=Rickettsia endosymbiont of Cantharis rufa TaxID=3066248 RepID=UPI003132FF1E